RAELAPASRPAGARGNRRRGRGGGARADDQRQLRGTQPGGRRHADARGALVFAAAAGACWLVFFRPEGTAFLFAVFPVLLLAVAWLGSLGVRSVAVLISALILSAACLGWGQFTWGTQNE